MKLNIFMHWASTSEILNPFWLGTIMNRCLYDHVIFRYKLVYKV